MHGETSALSEGAQRSRRAIEAPKHQRRLEGHRMEAVCRHTDVAAIRPLCRHHGHAGRKGPKCLAKRGAVDCCHRYIRFRLSGHPSECGMREAEQPSRIAAGDVSLLALADFDAVEQPIDYVARAWESTLGMGIVRSPHARLMPCDRARHDA